ncbi:MAG: energy transducer TonB, partial [Ignavibacteria bacterium]
MKTASNLMAVPLNFEELLFTNKNKEYGSYILRKSYKKQLAFSSFFVVIFYSLVISWPLMYKTQEVITDSAKKNTITVTIGPPPIIEDKKINDPVTVIPKMNTVKFTPPIVAPDNIVKEEIFPDIEKLTAALPWIKTEVGNEGGIDITFLETKETITNIEAENMKHVFTWVEEMPHYLGGQESLLEFITSKIIYPEIAKRAGIQGRVITSFTVEIDGRITDIKIEKAIGAACHEEAAR